MYSGPGPASLLTAASAWNKLATELASAAVSYSAVIAGLTSSSWQGPSSASMATAAAPYVAWLHTVAAQAEESATQANAAAGAYEVAFAMTVPPPVIAANRAQLMSLIATNVLGQNAPAIAATEAHYGEMWAQDAAAMYGYAGAAGAASTLTPFTEPPTATNPETQSLASPSPSSTSPISAVNALNTLAMPLRNAAYLATTPITAMNSLNSMAKSMGSTTAVTASGVKAAGSGMTGGLALTALGSAPALGGGGAAVSAGIGRAVSIGPLSVPQAWTAVPAAASPAAAALPATSVGVAPVTGSAGVPPLMPITSMAGRTANGATPQYDMRPSVIPRSPSAG
ncbi:PPE family protein [Mycobacterium fragae]|uniref:PPE family protein n=2 Tax=Mycobacterium fragae TaxID=1260918 RepID=A0A1X1UX52_9MYCO|nr:hypothetical protein AWC06_12900 [Mycobacterium fragae]